MSSKLECPFCGGTDVLQERDGVHCEDCGGSAPALAAWNRRTPDWRALAWEAGKALAALLDSSVYADGEGPIDIDRGDAWGTNRGEVKAAHSALAAIKATGLEV